MPNLVDIKESWSGIDAFHESKDGKSGSVGTRRMFTVLYDSPGATPLDALVADDGILAIPSPGDGHPGNSSLRMTRKTPKAISQILYEVEAEYEAQLTGDGAYGSTLGITDFEWFTVYTTEAVDESIDGEPLVNPNGERYDNQEVEWGEQGLRISANVLTFYAYDANEFINATNSDQWGTWPRGTAKCKGLGARQQKQGGVFYWSVNGEFHFRRKGRMSHERRAWWRRIRCEGLRFRIINEAEPDLVKLFNAVDSNGDPVSQPILLNLDGTAMEIPPPSEIAEGRLPQAKWQEFPQFYERPFNALGFVPPP